MTATPQMVSRGGSHGLQNGYATTRHGQLHYAQAGGGEPLLLLHAAARTHRSFRRMLPLLAPHVRAIAVDLPGFGNSHGLDGLTSIEAIAGCLIQLLDDLAIPRAHVFGLHTGNKLAAALAAKWPDRIAKLILASQTHSIILDRAHRDAEIRKFSDRHFPKFAASADGAHLVRAWAGANATVQGFWWPPSLLNASMVTAADIEDAEVRVLDYLQGWHSIVPLYEAIFAFDLTETLQRIAAPTLVLELRADDEAHLPSQAEPVCRIMRNAQADTIAGADGLVLEKRPGDVVQSILRFLAS